MYLVIAQLCLFMGFLGGFEGTTAARVVWWLCASMWLCFYFWALWSPYLHASTDQIVVRASPFSTRVLSRGSVDSVEVAATTVTVDPRNELVTKIDLRRLEDEDRGELVRRLEEFRTAADQEEERCHEEFVARWGVDPETWTDSGRLEDAG